jgi:hypothetical protein
MSLVPADFIARIEAEIEANQHKGDWPKVKMSPLRISLEINHHAAKLARAYLNEEPERIREHAADIAATCLKAWQQTQP